MPANLYIRVQVWILLASVAGSERQHERHFEFIQFHQFLREPKDAYGMSEVTTAKHSSTILQLSHDAGIYANDAECESYMPVSIPIVYLPFDNESIDSCAPGV